MEKLVIERNKEDFYRLQINDTNDYIEFDLTDISLPERVMNAADNIAKLDAEYQKEKENIVSTCENEEEKVRKLIRLEKEKSLAMRKEFDSFLGDGSCQKIFGDANYYGMYLQLFNALEPHFKKMQIKLKKGKEKLAKKYLNNDGDTI